MSILVPADQNAMPGSTVLANYQDEAGKESAKFSPIVLNVPSSLLLFQGPADGTQVSGTGMSPANLMSTLCCPGRDRNNQALSDKGCASLKRDTWICIFLPLKDG